MWTDLKLDNMVLTGNGQVKAIDLESAVPARSAPKTFSTEATPPDFFAASRDGVSQFRANGVQWRAMVTYQIVAAIFDRGDIKQDRRYRISYSPFWDAEYKQTTDYRLQTTISRLQDRLQTTNRLQDRLQTGQEQTKNRLQTTTDDKQSTSRVQAECKQMAVSVVSAVFRCQICVRAQHNKWNNYVAPVSCSCLCCCSAETKRVISRRIESLCPTKYLPGPSLSSLLIC